MTRKPRKTRPGRAPAMPPEERIGTILEAARQVFLERGFAAARVEDVAARAGVAKGTIYNHFASKEALFKALIASIADAPLGRLEALLRELPAQGGQSSAEILRGALAMLRSQILGTERRFVLRLLLTEGHRFPEVARFHHDRVVVRAMDLLRAIVERGVARGEFGRDTLARFPQLFAAPLLMAVLWEGLFGAQDPLDLDGLMEAHMDMLLHGLEAQA